jgi:regulator of sirC expression with transglutaminase-like and TPR domain
MPDPTLRDLLAQTDAPIEHAALLIARDAYPDLSIEASLAELDRLAAPLQARLAAATTPHGQAAVLGTYLYDELGFRGDEETYYDPRNSYLNQVLARRTGIPITLAVVLIALGRRAGLTIEGVGFPGHFLVRIGGPDGVYVDPFFSARVLSTEALERLLRRTLGSGARLEPEYLDASDTHAMAVRMLMNLKAIYESRKEHARALVVCDRLVDLTGLPERRRDRGRHAIALGAYAGGVMDLEAYLSACPDAVDASHVRAALEQARKKSSARTASN